jgi:hypothetical protein
MILYCHQKATTESSWLSITLWPQGPGSSTRLMGLSPLWQRMQWYNPKEQIVVSDRSLHEFCDSGIFWMCYLYKYVVDFYWMQFTCIPKTGFVLDFGFL